MDIREIRNIEKSFFEIDEEEKAAKIVLKYDKQEDLFDPVYVSDPPVLNRDPVDHIMGAFSLVSSEYKVDLTLRFNELDDGHEKKLRDCIKKNLMLEVKTRESASRRRDRLAYAFIIAGVVCFFAMLMISSFWKSESAWRELFFYMFDIKTTVSRYEAVTILSVEKKEKLAALMDLHKRFSDIHFERSAESYDGRDRE